MHLLYFQKTCLMLMLILCFSKYVAANCSSTPSATPHGSATPSLSSRLTILGTPWKHFLDFSVITSTSPECKKIGVGFVSFVWPPIRKTALWPENFSLVIARLYKSCIKREKSFAIGRKKVQSVAEFANFSDFCTTLKGKFILQTRNCNSCWKSSKNPWPCTECTHNSFL